VQGVVAQPARLVSTFIDGPAGRLEAILRLPAEPKGAALVAHPHPLHGGSMHTKVVHRAAKLLCDRFGLAALRFNFRGVGASQGVHDEGRGEVGDVLAAAAWVRREVPQGPFVLGGFSFGSVAALDAAPSLTLDAHLLIGLPLRRWTTPQSAPYAGPVVWVQGSNDEFADPGSARVLAERWGWDLRVVPGADHFFAGKLDEFEREAGDGIARVLGAAAP
jgi:alpha/beta superfamily hydrolase